MSGEVAVIADDYTVGDLVIKYNDVFPGVVVGVHPGIEQVDVQFPTGVERCEPEELIHLSKYNLYSNLDPQSKNFIKSEIRDKVKNSQYIKLNSEIIKRPSITRAEQLEVLVDTHQASFGTRKAKIARYVADQFTTKELVAYKKRQARFEKIMSIGRD